MSEFDSALDFAAAQAQRIIAKYPGYHPMYTVKGIWKREGELWTHWCEGFFPGILWLLHKHTGEPHWRTSAEEYSKRLEPRRFDRNVHDLGFLFFSTYLRWYRLTGDPALREVLIDAGKTLALRRQKGGYLASFIGPQSLFIDIMMNVGIIIWAANATGDDALRDIAVEHCRTTQKYLVRPDGGTAHEGIFDLESGRFLRESTHQGYKPESTWTRGLAWSLYGFTAVHRLLSANPSYQATEFLDTARRCADCYIRRAPKDGVPLWDFDAPPLTPPSPPGGEGRVRGADGNQPYDSSAAAIAASGLWDLSEEVRDPAEQHRYREGARTILHTLCSDRFLARGRPEWEGILMHGVYHFHKGLGVDESVAWGEHFFVEGLVKACAGKSAAAW